MRRFKVAVTDYVFPNLDPEQELLGAVEAELVVGQCKSKEEALALVRGVDAVLNTYYGPIDGEVMDAMPDCRIIVRYGIGVDTIDIPAATARGIMVANVPDYCIDEVADQAVSMLLALLRKLPVADRNIRRGEWALATLKPLQRINALTVGIIGMGRIGRAITARLQSFGPRLLFADPYFRGEPPAGTTQVALDELYASVDAVIVQAPASAETRHLLDGAAFAAMTRKPVIVNCARGELIDTPALIEALQAGTISGAGLDVIEGTPPLPADSPLLQCDNVILTPHSAWFSAEALQSLQRLACLEVARALRDERPKALLNPEALERRHAGVQ
ncbi:MAG TPA: C-terminal binding protein [Armatimonadota bacterium]|jgi:D-3-phosphoglycerate dehydrogenase